MNNVFDETRIQDELATLMHEAPTEEHLYPQSISWHTNGHGMILMCEIAYEGSSSPQQAWTAINHCY